MFFLLSAAAAFVITPVVSRHSPRFTSTIDAPVTVAGVNLKDELDEVEKKIEDIEGERKASGLLTKKRLSASEKRQLETYKEDLDRWALEEANLYRILAGEDVKDPSESKSFSASDLTLEHITFATGIDVIGSEVNFKRWAWDDLPQDGPSATRDFPEDVVDRLACDWERTANRTILSHETSHRSLIDLVLRCVVFEYFEDLALAHEFPVSVTKVRSGTTYGLGGNLDYSVVYDPEVSLGFGAANIIITPLLPLACIVVEAKTEVLNRHLNQLLAEMCTLKKIHTDAKKQGPLRGVLSNGEKWMFTEIDEDCRFYRTLPLYVGYKDPIKKSLRTILRFFYAALTDARNAQL